MPGPAPDPADVAAVAAFVRSRGFAVVATVTADHRPEAAFLGVTALDDGTLVMDTPASARKADNLRALPRAAMVVGLTGGVSVQLEGDAVLHATGAERDRLAAAYEDLHPGSRAHDPTFVVVSVHPRWVRVYDATVEPSDVREATWPPG